ncbi:MAG: hypothetical protein IJL63_06100 [Clostridia bacterium]|nr:hypothetical protein [Clostridia bacterium]
MFRQAERTGSSPSPVCSVSLNGQCFVSNDYSVERIDIPCNHFGAQASGTDGEIHEFCTMHFNTAFPQMKKSDVNGENEFDKSEVIEYSVCHLFVTQGCV